MTALVIFVLAALLPSLGAAEKSAPPELTSLFPLGGTPGSSFEATILGKHLEHAAAVWSPSAGLTAEIMTLESGATAKDADRLRLRFHLTAQLPSGPHDLRLITQQGLSNPLRLLVHLQPAMLEQSDAHDRARQAQPVEAWPVAVHGRIAEVGEVDFYSFRAEAGQEILFRTFSSDGLDPGLAIYELSGSWFDPDRPTRLAVADEGIGLRKQLVLDAD